ncbi:MAG: OmpA family protein [Acidiferrobacterales bacterium]
MKIGRFVVTISLFFVLASVFAVDRAKQVVFQDAKNAFDAAESAQASFYSPKNHARAVRHYRSAEKKFTGDPDAAAFRDDLALAIEYFNRALAVSKRGQAMLASALKARADAEKVKAPTHAGNLWQRGEQRLAKAISDLERDAVATAEQRAAEAEQAYRDAELDTIKVTYLNEARLALAQAKRDKVGRYAPRTLKKAEDLLTQAESALDKNRYDADRPRNLTQQAQYEIRHAVYLAGVIRIAKGAKLTPEDLILDSEIPLSKVAAAAEINASFDSGYDAPAKRIIGYIEDQQERVQKLEQNNNDLKAEIRQLQEGLAQASDERTALSERLDVQMQRREGLERDIKSLQAEIQQLQLSLGGVSEERVVLSDQLESQAQLRENLEKEVTTLKREIDVLEQLLKNVSAQRELLSKQLDTQTRVRERVEKIERLFTRDEARVSRQFDDIVIRLVGLQFPSGQSTIRSENLKLLQKVGQAIQLVPGSRLSIEGHTDSFGSDATNLALSQKRAEAVKKYLVANMQLDPSTIDAIGYGETRPVANNETPEGRARNRRIEVVIKPKVGS